MRIGVGRAAKGHAGLRARHRRQVAHAPNLADELPDGRQTERIARLDLGRVPDDAALTLRQDVYFHDGTRLTPELAVQALKQSSVKTDRTPVEFLERPVRHAERRRRHRHQAVGAELLLPPRPVADRPSRLPDKPEIGDRSLPDRQRTQQQAALQAFDRYYRGRPTHREDRHHQLPDAAQRLGGADARRDRHAPRSQPRRRGVRRGRDARSRPTPSRARTTIRWSSTSAIRSSSAPRSAARSTRRSTATALIRDGMNGRGRPADGPIWPEHWAYSTASRAVRLQSRRGAAAARRRPGCSVQPGDRRHGCPAGSRSPASSSPTTALRAAGRAGAEAARRRRRRHELVPLPQRGAR